MGKNAQGNLPPKDAPKDTPPEKIAILGTASSSVMDAPFKDETWTIWSLCFNYNKIPRFNKLFEIHHPDVLTEAGMDPTAIQNLQKYKENLITFNKSTLFPDGTRFPWELVVQQFPRRYFTSSIAWMLALAIMSKPKEIALYGVDMCDTDEYAYQKGACEYLIGIAEGQGIKVTIAKDSPLCRTPRMYALEDVGISRELVIRRKNLKAEMNRQEESYLRSRDMYHFFKGRVHEAEDISNRWR